MYDVYDHSRRQSGKKYNMKGFLTIQEAETYIDLLRRRMIKGDFSIWCREKYSPICEKMYMVNRVTI